MLNAATEILATSPSGLHQRHKELEHKRCLEQSENGKERSFGARIISYRFEVKCDGERITADRHPATRRTHGNRSMIG